MENEGAIIPYHSIELTGKRALVFSPHPDDETIGCGGSLALHAAAGDQVKVVFLTDGAKGDTSGRIDRDSYVAIRQKEAERACACLGISDFEFWSYEDRGLAGSRGVLRRIMDLFEVFRPELVYVPSPMEFHPDHRAACFLVCDAIKGCPFDFDVAFYEVGQPIWVNLLVDISSVIDLKQRAIEAYESQLRERDYKGMIMALNRFRRLTLSEGVTHAEGYSFWSSDMIRKIGPYAIPFQKLNRLTAGAGEAGPLVSIIVRTKDRPVLLANTLISITCQTYANLEIVVVNDGGEDVETLVKELSGNIPVTYVHHENSLGRSYAANSGLKAAKGLFLNFLDDDDVLYPDHVEALVAHIMARQSKVVFSSVMNAYFSGLPGSPGQPVKEELIFNFDFDADILLFQNYIPIMSVLFSREVLSKVDGFNEDMSLFEDWDFWIRVSRHFLFDHLDKVTAEYRFYGVNSTEVSHRQKYQYDDALADVFNRSLPLLNGKAWVRFLNEGSMGAFRSKMHGRGADFAEIEERLSAFQSRIHDLEEKDQFHKEELAKKHSEVTEMISKYEELLALNARLEEKLSAFQSRIHDLEEKNEFHKEELDKKHSEASEMISKYEELLARNADLENMQQQSQQALDRIREQFFYRVYRKIKGIGKTS
ncbi:MAG: PIG-L family deacetylase [Deltaproteobacteria bacterium]|nr:PIG-L family deacetylase [Deltaproteobacteria bacterium]